MPYHQSDMKSSKITYADREFSLFQLCILRIGRGVL